MNTAAAYTAAVEAANPIASAPGYTMDVDAPAAGPPAAAPPVSAFSAAPTPSPPTSGSPFPAAAAAACRPSTPPPRARAAAPPTTPSPIQVIGRVLTPARKVAKKVVSPESSDDEGRGEDDQSPGEVFFKTLKSQFPLDFGRMQKNGGTWWDYNRIKGSCEECGRVGGMVVKAVCIEGTGTGEDQLWVLRCMFCNARKEVGNNGKVPKAKVATTQTTTEEWDRMERGLGVLRRNTGDTTGFGGNAW